MEKQEYILLKINLKTLATEKLFGMSSQIFRFAIVGEELVFSYFF